MQRNERIKMESEGKSQYVCILEVGEVVKTESSA